ncbi:DUF6794 domain-containing protein [Longimicrobium terrae]|uniref:DUF6794 domain-containing protein n=1 Tax=Longimicrobium terrae TaxID=1639882 RepID=A0A841GNH9_9BACT|nr:DUF6794 domain-containing protein [Longimicrobium terrae]MBB4634238.1 hypothetical protein [Longimicrobium terrae]MBB6068872.1 hypothetical protein [Longimicrobium terrae]NNC28052.1 hypothetical protein [Longimicrobium terrae]
MNRWLLGAALALAACSGREADRRVPAAVAPAFALLDSTLTAADRQTLRRTLPDSAILYHHTLGMGLRNEAGLWRGGPVADSLRARGVRHPDNMSHVILQAYGFHLRGQPVPLDSLIRALPPPPAPSSFIELNDSAGTGR